MTLVEAHRKLRAAVGPRDRISIYIFMSDPALGADLQVDYSVHLHRPGGLVSTGGHDSLATTVETAIRRISPEPVSGEELDKQLTAVLA